MPKRGSIVIRGTERGRAVRSAMFSLLLPRETRLTAPSSVIDCDDVIGFVEVVRLLIVEVDCDEKIIPVVSALLGASDSEANHSILQRSPV